MSIYLFAPFIILGIMTLIKRFIHRKIRQQMRIRGSIEHKESLSKKMTSGLSFVLTKDKRKTLGIKNKYIVIGLYVIGLLGTIFFALRDDPITGFIFILFPYIAGIFSFVLFAPIRQERDELINRLVSIKRDRMGLVEKGKRGEDFDPNLEVKVIKWKEDNVNPELIEMSIPTSFDPLNTAAFLEHFNTYFGNEATWVPDKSDGKLGWDFKKFKLYLAQTPPLPKKAMWDSRYLNPDYFAWSFFPLGLASENGVEIVNEETGEVENVIGFDLAGAQIKLAKEKNLKIGNEIQAAPQVLIAGGTGGGKALSSDTMIPVIKED